MKKLLIKTFYCNQKSLLGIILLSGILIMSCSNNKNQKIENKVDSSKIGKIKTVLILGNSIVRHLPRPEIGWYNDWGMAATVIDSDFVHILINDIKQKDSTIKIRYKNIADFENNFVTYPLTNLDSLRSPDMLILRISENVNGKKAEDSNFIAYYDRLINTIDPSGKSIKVIVDGFWQKGYRYKWHHIKTVERENVNNMIKQYAITNNYPFITTTDLSLDSTNMAGKRFTNLAVAIHPSDKGMRMIAGRVWAYIKAYF